MEGKRLSGYPSLCRAILILQGIGRRYANVVCKKADVDLNKRAGELTEEEVGNIAIK